MPELRKNIIVRMLDKILKSFKNFYLSYRQGFLIIWYFFKSLLWFLFSSCLAYALFEFGRGQNTPLWILFAEEMDFKTLKSAKNDFQNSFIILVSLILASYLDALLRESRAISNLVIVIFGFFTFVSLFILHQGAEYVFNDSEVKFNIFENGTFKAIIIFLVFQILSAKTASFKSYTKNNSGNQNKLLVK